MRYLTTIFKYADRNRKQFFWVFASALILSSGTYVYSVNSVAYNTAERGEIEAEIAEKNASLAEIESRYLTLKQSVNLSSAYKRGFEDARAVTFITSKTLGAATANRDI